MAPWGANNGEAFAGLHNKGSRLPMVFDEASAIADTIWDTAEGALTDAGTEIVQLARWVADHGEESDFVLAILRQRSHKRAA